MQPHDGCVTLRLKFLLPQKEVCKRGCYYGRLPDIQRFATLRVLRSMKDGVNVMSSFRKAREDEPDSDFSRWQSLL
jgi:hypothetical protein